MGLLALRVASRSWPAIPPDIGQAILALGADSWPTIIPEVTAADPPPVRASLARFAGESGIVALAPLASQLARDPDRRVWSEASRSLLLLAIVGSADGATDDSSVHNIALRAVSKTEHDQIPGLGVPRHELSDLDRSTVRDAIATAAAALADRLPRSVALAMLLAPYMTRADKLAELLASPSFAGNGVIRQVLRTSRLPQIRLAAARLSAVPHLQEACATRLAVAHGPNDHAALLEVAHLFRRPIRKAMRIKVRRDRPTITKSTAKNIFAGDVPRPLGATCAVPGPVFLPALSDHAQLALPGFIRVCTMDDPTRTETLAPLLARSAGVVRFAAASISPQSLDADWCADESETISRHAALRVLLSRDPARMAPIANRFLRSPHAQTRAITRCIARSVTSRDASLAVRARTDLVALTAELRRDLSMRLRERSTAVQAAATPSQDTAADAVAAIQTIRKLGLAASLAEPLIEALSSADPSPRIAAAAVTALAEVPGGAASEAILSSLQAADARVRANAAEAMARRLRLRLLDPSDRLAELKNDPHHRVRANSLRAELMGIIRGDGEADLAAMLADTRSQHRLAAVWVAAHYLPSTAAHSTREPWSRLASGIAELARHDQDLRVRVRASACLSNLSHWLGAAWSARLPAHVEGATP